MKTLATSSKLSGLEQSGKAGNRVTPRGMLIAVMVFVMGAAAAVTGWTDTFKLGSPVKVSGPSPFAGCTADDPASQPGTLVPNTEVEPWLAVNPTNPSNLVAVWIQDWFSPPGQAGRGIVAGVSLDGGKSWKNVAIPGITLCSGGSNVRAADPWLAFAINGDLYLIAEGMNVSSTNISPPGRILVSKSTDGGLTWGPVVTLIDDQNNIHDKASITADPADPDLVYAIWNQAGGQSPVMFSRTVDGGRSWEPARPIYNGPSSWVPIGNQIVVLPDGTLLDFFSDLRDQTDPGGGASVDAAILSLIRSTDRGVTWESKEPTRIAINKITCPSLAGCVTDPETGQPVRGVQIFFDVAVDPNNGNLYLQWADGRFSNYQYPSIAFSRSTDGGLTWSTPIRINRTPTNIAPGNQQAFGSSIHVAPGGTVGVAYYDFRFNDPSPGLLTDYWLVHCHAGTDCTDPANWRDENRLTSASFDMEKAVPALFGLFVGDYQGMTADGGDLLAVWSQPHGKDRDSVFFQRVEFPTLHTWNSAHGEGSACYGDSGGPLLFDYQSTEYLIGNVGSRVSGQVHDCTNINKGITERVDSASSLSFILSAITSNP